ncbi:MAG: cytochrome C oxidase subunit IV family protein [Nitrososphaerota archaeon]|nr:cytochrome C oxidase subunit IV family protein [Nitrososphaerota archaeon]MDG6975197.1 cytochrome C oxidase subunit IV family protein [Nitrososphaerota archaeon]MDG7010069.1 cytochrome C oxidase subunit IV family protein [Nitrososphaerota archaeon]MDG7019493.1 cytochrome C oxidase subunit IV family protein [Nitrososphaerota archaeon]MDG7027211.1 cytochrome C oxidase subunit IV family protein [Nitrososphaerota archaeon]
MRTLVGVGVWVYMVVAVLTEVLLYYQHLAYPVLVSVVSILATSQGVAIVLFYMQMKDEPASVKLFAIIPLMFLSALLVAELASLG